MNDTTTVVKAAMILQEIQAALQRGTKHYNSVGKLLTTPREIIGCLLDEGEITFQPSNTNHNQHHYMKIKH